MSRRGNDVDDRPSTALINHQLGDMLGAQKSAGEHDIELLAPLRYRHVQNPFGVEDDGVVDQDIDARIGFRCLGDDVFNLRFIRHITGDT